jgi:hypothetical protein
MPEMPAQQYQGVALLGAVGSAFGHAVGQPIGKKRRDL